MAPGDTPLPSFLFSVVLNRAKPRDRQDVALVMVCVTQGTRVRRTLERLPCSILGGEGATSPPDPCGEVRRPPPHSQRRPATL